MAAAPHLFDEPFVASPELALVDGDLAAQLREDIRSGEEFRPRAAARPEFRLLHPVGGVDVDVDPAVAPEPDLADGLHDAVDVLPEVDPVVVALETPQASPEVAQTPEPPDEVVLADELLVEDVVTDDEVVEVETDAVGAALDVASDGNDVSELPDDVVLTDDVFVEDSAQEDEVAEVVELPEYVVPHDEVVEVELVDLEPVAVDALPAPPEVDESAELPDYVVTTDESVGDIGETAFLGFARTQPPVSEEPSLPDYVVLPADSLVADTVPVGTEHTTSDYPELPDLGASSEVLEETDAALRRIREQFTTKEARPTKRRLRRRFTIASGLGAMAVAAAFAVNAHLGANVLGF